MQEQHERYAPWGKVTPDFWETGTRHQNPLSVPSTDPPARPEAAAEARETATVDRPSAPPVEYRDRINAIVTALSAPHDAARLANAAAAAGQLDQEFTQRYGERHANTINLRELRGQLSYQQGQLSVAVRWCLHTTGLQAQLWGRDHRLTRGSIQRAVRFWLDIPQGTQESLATGQEVLAMLTPLQGEDSTLHSMVRARLNAGGGQSAFADG